MKRIELLLAQLGEECGEVQQIVGKSQRFGMNDFHPTTDEINHQRLRQEIHDVLAVYWMICDEHWIDGCIDKELIKAKQAKVERYHLLSIEKGILKP